MFTSYYIVYLFYFLFLSSRLLLLATLTLGNLALILSVAARKSSVWGVPQFKGPRERAWKTRTRDHDDLQKSLISCIQNLLVWKLTVRGPVQPFPGPRETLDGPGLIRKSSVSLIILCCCFCKNKKSFLYILFSLLHWAKFTVRNFSLKKYLLMFDCGNARYHL